MGQAESHDEEADGQEGIGAAGPEDAGAIKRQVPLEEGEETGKAFADYVKTLELAHGSADGTLLEKRRDCGLGCGGNDEGTARKFARVIQDMIRRLLSEPSKERMRIFDNHTVTFDVEAGLLATFTECRSTQFRRLRAAAGFTEDEYCKSMCGAPFAGGSKEKSGKSGSLFLRSHDGRLVLKTIEQHEFEALHDILPNYVLYLEENASSLLCRFFAAYSLNVGATTLRFVVMANVLPHKALQVYDLKGTTEDRWVDPLPNRVLKDNNFQSLVMVLDPEDRQRIVQVIRDDAEFLESLGLMDYSLLVGMSEECTPTVNRSCKAVPGALRDLGKGTLETQVFQLGIIDYLQRWTSKKVAAHWLKKPTIGCFHEIDTEPPKIYCSRFYKYLAQKIVAKASQTAVTNGHA
mmetsp:Transcript_47135/g.131539  ORF Transcript_47135/g.131539 Transcript_47135/m.131539 type:complete len:406 (+) Transcript_47135:164-1381(+)